MKVSSFMKKRKEKNKNSVASKTLKKDIQTFY